MNEKPKHGATLFSVEVLRTDGTAWLIENVKHVIEGSHVMKFYVGEHGTGRKVIWIPVCRIDHLNLLTQ
jgi:hypothetical protein